MARFLSAFMITVMAAMAFAAVAHEGHEHWKTVTDVEKDEKVQRLGTFAVTRYNEQNHGKLKFVSAVEAKVLDRGTEHYTYRMVLKVDTGAGIKLFKVEVLDDLSAPGTENVHNLGYFMPL